MNNPLKALIIEDEHLASKRLEKLMEPYADEVEIVGKATNGEEGLELIDLCQPDFIFLDIQMPVMNGLEMLMKLEKQPYIVFTTAYDEYALQSFEENSIDYLLKPIQPKRLEKTIQKLLNITRANQSAGIEVDQLAQLVNQLQKPKPINVIRANVGDRIVIIKLENILYLKAEDKLTTVVTADEKEYFITPSLSQLQPKLPENFIQLSRSYIANEDYVTEIRKGFNRKLIFEMKDGEKITVGTSFSTTLKERWKM